ncbi:8cc49e07-1eec-41e6-800a-5c1107dae2e3 [Sclerotinia trifoliorum]|uniref:8cc49e07-1eec-41e6-800a-5c1107dae2e3 n=1 Tax=Sclerotinia trifoliorum TaxID=28548 RepID=A0A8H2ZXN0_9HELO|nr:8cc49e07-1eec-41e6-800a-5c1107dae2e3 [Sclerotinia trifoliorum]
MDLKRVQYDQLPLEEDSIPPEKQKTISTGRRLVYGLVCAVLMVLTTIGTFWAWSHRHPNLPQYLDCGSTTEEALAKGCVMEPMIYGWVPQECYFPELSKQYSPFEDRKWYTDATYSVQIPPADLWAGKRKHVFTHMYHSTHCFFLWRKLALGVAKRADYLDDKSLELEHADHCAEILDHYGGETMNSTNDVVLGFHRCERLAWT